MALTDEQVVGVNVALNEAAFLTIDPSGLDHGRVAVVVRPPQLGQPGPNGISGPAAHHLNLAKVIYEEPHRTLQLRVWFDDLTVTSATGEPIDLDAFIDGGRRWWTALHADDPRVRRTPPA